MILASVVVGRRAIPVHNRVISKTLMERSQNKEENEFLKSIVSTLKEIGVVAVLLCDRGFRKVSWIKLLKELEQHFVVRLVADVMVHKGGSSTLPTFLMAESGIKC